MQAAIGIGMAKAAYEMANENNQHLSKAALAACGMRHVAAVAYVYQQISSVSENSVNSKQRQHVIKQQHNIVRISTHLIDVFTALRLRAASAALLPPLRACCYCLALLPRIAARLPASA